MHQVILDHFSTLTLKIVKHWHAKAVANGHIGPEFKLALR